MGQILLIRPALLTWYAPGRVKDVFRKHDAERAGSGLTGTEAAERLLAPHRLYDVAVERTRGRLTYPLRSHDAHASSVGPRRRPSLGFGRQMATFLFFLTTILAPPG